MKKGHKRKQIEDTTEFGEFVCSAYHWLPLEKQKEQAERLQNITKDRDDN